MADEKKVSKAPKAKRCMVRKLIEKELRGVERVKLLLTEPKLIDRADGMVTALTRVLNPQPEANSLALELFVPTGE